jgi:hypothetical protein
MTASAVAAVSQILHHRDRRDATAAGAALTRLPQGRVPAAAFYDANNSGPPAERHCQWTPTWMVRKWDCDRPPGDEANRALTVRLRVRILLVVVSPDAS